MRILKSLVIFLFLGFLIFSTSLSNSFVWDDDEVLVKNTSVHSLKNIKLFFLGGFFNSGGGGLIGDYYRPIPTTIYSLIYTAFGLNPQAFHLFQISIYILNSFFLFRVFSILFQRSIPKFPIYIPLFLSLIFLTHPVNSEVAIYISDLQDALFFFFGISSLLLIMQSPLNFKFQIIIFLLFLLSLLSKETGIIFIFLSLIYLLLFKKHSTLPFLKIAFPSLVIFLLAKINTVGLLPRGYHIAPIANLPLLERLTSIPKIIEYYLLNFFYPNNLSIAQYWTVDKLDLHSFYLPLIIDLLIFLVIIAFGVLIKRKYSSSFFRLYLFFIVWFLLSLTMHIQIIPLDLTVATRWFYPVMPALLGLLGLLLWMISESINKKSILVIAGLLIVLILSLTTFQRNQDWKDPFTLYSHDIRFNNSFSLENNLGIELLNKGKRDDAKKFFQSSVNKAPRWWPNWNNLGVVYEREDNIAKAKEAYQRSINNNERYYIAYENLARLLLFKEKDATGAAKLSKKALKFLPNNSYLQDIYQKASFLPHSD